MTRKILILAANPINTSPLRLDQEMREIDEGLRRSRNSSQFVLEKRLAVRTEDLRRSLLDEEPQFVHFSGHGAGSDGIVVEDIVGASQLVKAEALANLFKLFSGQIECVILNACYSEIQAQAISRHIKYVIGMKQAIGDQAAIQFSTGFYDAIGAGRSIEDAFEFGKNAIELNNLPDDLIPVIKKNENFQKYSAILDTHDSRYKKLESILTKIYLLLWLDQFPSGVWGTSIESTLSLYGKANDPGSISVSVSSAIALTSISGSTILDPVCQFRDYLFARRSHKGAFGMKKFVGSALFPEEIIFENSRHTASALNFFLKYDGWQHECSMSALSYLLDFNHRTTEGLWVDQGEISSSKVDPITVASVINALERSFQAFKEEKHSNGKLIEQINCAIENGINYLFETNLRTDQGFWVYRYSTEKEYYRVLSNTYRYTSGILGDIKESCKRLNLKMGEIENLTRKLVNISENYDGGLPSSISSNVPSISATINLMVTSNYLWDLRDKLDSNLDRILNLYNRKSLFENAMAPGWAALARLFPLYQDIQTVLKDRIEDLDDISKRTLKNPSIIPEALMEHKDMVEEMLKKRNS